MNMSHDEMIAVIQAHKKGRMIRCRPRGRDCEWASCDPAPSWDFYRYEYEVVPEPPKPREFWSNEYSHIGLSSFHPTEEAARNAVVPGYIRTVRFREVIEEGGGE